MRAGASMSMVVGNTTVSGEQPPCTSNRMGAMSLVYSSMCESTRRISVFWKTIQCGPVFRCDVPPSGEVPPSPAVPPSLPPATLDENVIMHGFGLGAVYGFPELSWLLIPKVSMNVCGSVKSWSLGRMFVHIGAASG